MPKYLELRRQTWFVSVEVPPSLRDKLGKRLKKTTGTRDLQLAEAKKWAIVAELKGRIGAARSGALTLVDEALQYRHEYQSASSEGDRSGIFESIADHAAHIRGDPISEQVDHLGDYQYDSTSLKKANEFFGIAVGQLTPVETYLDTWIAESHFTPRTANDHRRAVARLKEQGISTVEQVDRKRAGSFVSWMLNHRSPGWTGDQKTVTKYISSLSSYWRWLERKGHAPSNPWIGQAPPKRKARSIDADTLERPFTDDEVKELLSGPVDAELSDLMRIGALTGARIDAIVSLKVSDCVNGMLRFKPQKKEKSHRFVPIHSDLQELVANRCKGKAPGEYLFHEAPEVPEGSARERSMPVSKRFGRYMRARKVAVLLEGKRRSLVNFHSFRRWFVTKAEQAGQPVHIIEAVVGHTRSGMTLGVYSGGPSTEQLRACVESVRLPQ